MSRVTTLAYLANASSLLQSAHRQALDDGEPELAGTIHAAGDLVAKAVGQLVVAESKRLKAVQP